jgi:hypothetical protein
VPDWTEDEARAYLPRLRQLLGILRRAADLAVRVRANGHGSIGQDQADHDREVGAPSTEMVELPPGIGPAAALAEIEERGVVLRDIERGLVDFPSRHPQGRRVLLCWQSGEDDLAWWHLPEEGFAGRRPLPLPPEL